MYCTALLSSSTNNKNKNYCIVPVWCVVLWSYSALACCGLAVCYYYAIIYPRLNNTKKHHHLLLIIKCLIIIDMNNSDAIINVNRM